MTEFEAVELLNEEERVLEVLERLDRRMDRMDRIVADIERRITGLDELKQDLVPIANGAFQIASRRLEAWEEAGALEFVREGARVAETIATSFTPEDVKLLGENVVAILETVRNLTQPEVLEVADRAAHALQDAEVGEGRPGLLRALRDREVRRGATLLLAVLRELGHEPRRAVEIAG